MYPFEKYLGKLKSYVRNKAQAKGSIAEGYMDEQTLTFCLFLYLIFSLTLAYMFHIGNLETLYEDN